MKIAEWTKKLSSHQIYSHDILSQDFEKNFGIPAPWQYYLAYEAGNSFDHRGFFLNDDIDANEKLVSGFEVAETLAGKYAAQTKSFKILGELSGRGSRFRKAVQALNEAHV